MRTRSIIKKIISFILIVALSLSTSNAFSYRVFAESTTSTESGGEELTIKEQLEAKLAEVEALNESDYTTETYTPLKTLVTAINANMSNETMIEQYGSQWISVLDAKIAALEKVEKELTVKEQLEAKLEEVEALNESDYTTETYTPLKTLATAISANISNETMVTQYGEQWLTVLQQKMDALEKSEITSSEDENNKISLEDGYYSISIKGYSNFNRNDDEQTDAGNMINQTALISVKDGKAQVTMRVAGCQAVEKVFILNQSYMEEFEASGSKLHFLPNASSISDSNGWKSTWLEKGYLSEEDQDYFLDDSKVQVDVNEEMWYGDVTFPVSDLSIDTIMRMAPNYNESQKNSQYITWALVAFDENSITKLADLPEDGSYTWQVIVEDGTLNTNSYNNGTYTTIVQELFENQVTLKIEDGSSSVSVCAKDPEQISDIKLLTGRTETNNFYDYFKRKSINSADYTSVYSNGNAVISFHLNSYEDIVFGKRVKVTMQDGTNYYALIRVAEGETKEVVLKDDVTDISFETTTLNVPEDSVLDVQTVDTAHESYELVEKEFSDTYKNYQAVDLNVLNQDGNTVCVTRAGTLKIPVDEDWNSNHLKLWRVKGDGFSLSQVDFTVEDGYVTLSTSYMGVYILCEEISYDTDGTQLTDGTYTVDVACWNMLLDQASMSNQGLVSPATLVIKDGTKYLYLEFKAVSNLELTSYMTDMSIYDKSVTYNAGGYPQGDRYDVLAYDYYKNEDGTFFADDFNAGSLEYYPKYICFELPSDEAEFPVRFRVPVMDAIGGGDFAQDARFRIDYSSAEKVSEQTVDVPIKKALGEMSAIAETAICEEYTQTSWSALEEAYKEACEVYEQDSASDTELTDAYTNLKAAINNLEKIEALELESGLYTMSITSDDTDSFTGGKLLVNEDGSATIQLTADGMNSLTYYDLTQKAYVNAQVLTEEDEEQVITKARLSYDSVRNVIFIKYVNSENTEISASLKCSDYEKQSQDTTKLEEAIQEANEKIVDAAQEPDKYEQDKVTTLQSEALQAIDLKSDKFAIQSELDVQVEALNNAVSDLMRNAIVTELKEAIENAAGLEEDLYTPDSYEKLTETIADSKELLTQESATGKELEAQLLELNASVEGLIIRADKTELKKVYEEASSITSQGQAGWDALQAVLQSAKKVLEDDNATAREVSEQSTALLNAMNNLNGGIDKSILSDLLTQAEALDVSQYSEESVAFFNAAITSAKAVYKNASATQTEIEKQAVLLEQSSNALIQKADENTVYEGVYSINGKLWHSAADQTSMGNAAISKPMQIIMKDGEATLRMEFVPLTASLGTKQFTGYLSWLKYFPDWDQSTLPTSQVGIETDIESYYENIYDSYNDPDSGTDATVKGQLYPHYMTMPVELNDEEIWVQVYVPVMESISTGSGEQYAKLKLDWSTLKQISGTDTDKTDLNATLTESKELLEQLDENSVGYSFVNLNMLQSAITAATAVSSNLNVDQTAVDSTETALQAAINVFNEEAVEVDKSELKTAISLADSYLNSETTVYTETTTETLKTARESAQTVYDSESATQSQVIAAINAISNAVNALVIDGSDKTELGKAIDAAKTYLNATSDYTAAALDVLQALYEDAYAVYTNKTASQEEVNAQISILNYAVAHLTQVEEVSDVVDKSELQNMIVVAASTSSRESVYTSDSITALKKVLATAQTVYANDSATQKQVNAQISSLLLALINMEAKETTSVSTSSSLDVNNLEDGIYSITGKMVKIDKSTASMSNEAINHTIKLTVKNGVYYITMDFSGLTINSQLGYLGTLKYFKTGYTLDSYGAPQGKLGSVTVDSYQMYSDGTKVSDSFGTDYPDVVTFPLISEALTNGYVPLQVFVPIMDSISSGSGTQPVFLKLDFSTLKQTTADDADFTDTSTNDSTTSSGTASSSSSSSSGITSTLPSSSSSSKTTTTAGTTTTTGSKISSSGVQSTGTSSLSGGTTLTSGTASLSSKTSSLTSGTSTKSTGSTLTSALSTVSANDSTKTSSTGSESDASNTTSSSSESSSSGAASKAVVPTVTSILALLAGILYKVKSRMWN